MPDNNNTTPSLEDVERRIYVEKYMNFFNAMTYVFTKEDLNANSELRSRSRKCYDSSDAKHSAGPLPHKKYIIWWKSPSLDDTKTTIASSSKYSYYYGNKSPECCNICFRVEQYDRINENKFSSGFSMTDTVRVRAKMEVECTKCNRIRGPEPLPVVDVTLLHLGDDALPSNQTISKNCITAANKNHRKNDDDSDIDYREQNTIIDPQFCEHCVACPDHPEANVNLLLVEEQVGTIPQPL